MIKSSANTWHNEDANEFNAWVHFMNLIMSVCWEPSVCLSAAPSSSSMAGSDSWTDENVEVWLTVTASK